MFDHLLKSKEELRAIEKGKQNQSSSSVDLRDLGSHARCSIRARVIRMKIKHELHRNRQPRLK